MRSTIVLLFSFFTSLAFAQQLSAQNFSGLRGIHGVVTHDNVPEINTGGKMQQRLSDKIFSHTLLSDTLPDNEGASTTVGSLGKEKEEASFKIYAIPAEEEIMIEGVSHLAELAVYDLKGNRHSAVPKYPFGQGMRLNIHQLPSGIYVLHIKDEELNKMMKLVKK